MMKKRFLLTLLAGAACASSAHAQSTLAIYGWIDEYAELANAGAGNVKRLSSGGASGSRLGFRGTEDLGSGARAVFVLENDFLPDTGTIATGRFFNRQSFVGLASDTFGTFTLGRQYTPYFQAMASNDPAGFTMGSALNYFAYPGLPVTPGRPSAGINGTLGDSTSRGDNSALYASPIFSGVQVKLFVSASEGTAPRMENASIAYSGPRLFGAVSYLTERTTYLANNIDRYTLAVAGYDFGVVKPAAIYVRRRGDAPNAPDVDAWQLGASAPVGLGILMGTYSKLTNKTNDTYSASGWGVRYDHLLSKRTRLYVGASKIVNKANAGFMINGGGSSSPGLALASNGADPRSVFLGVAHAF